MGRHWLACPSSENMWNEQRKGRTKVNRTGETAHCVISRCFGMGSECAHMFWRSQPTQIGLRKSFWPNNWKYNKCISLCLLDLQKRYRLVAGNGNEAEEERKSLDWNLIRAEKCFGDWDAWREMKTILWFILVWSDHVLWCFPTFVIKSLQNDEIEW